MNSLSWKSTSGFVKIRSSDEALLALVDLVQDLKEKFINNDKIVNMSLNFNYNDTVDLLKLTAGLISIKDFYISQNFK
jgi:hypothetical protein